MTLSAECIEAIRKNHYCGMGDCTICDLLAELDRLREERDNYKWEYENVCKFATQYEQERDALKAELEELSKCPNESWECAKEIKLLKAENEKLKAELKGQSLGMGDDFGDSPVEVIKVLKARLALAREVLRAFVNGGDKDAFWASNWEDCYKRAREALAKMGDNNAAKTLNQVESEGEWT